jgi:glyoxylase-like metal-dependent hydrolase (beta-lactamase superfamily II)
MFILHKIMINKISSEVFAIGFSNFGSIVYLIKLPNQNILIDTSSKENKEELISSLSSLSLSPENINTIILTHNHYDHVENIHLFPNAKIFSHKNIKELKIKEFKIYKTPGHSKEDIIILYKNILFSGDVIFHNDYIGRTDFPESNPKQMQESLNFIKTLKYNLLAPGH